MSGMPTVRIGDTELRRCYTCGRSGQVNDGVGWHAACPRGQTNWHTVVAFKKWAHYVRDNLHKRDLVEIAGYPHEREVKAKDGTTKTVHEIYVGFLKKLNKS